MVTNIGGCRHIISKPSWHNHDSAIIGTGGYTISIMSLFQV